MQFDRLPQRCNKPLQCVTTLRTRSARPQLPPTYIAAAEPSSICEEIGTYLRYFPIPLLRFLARHLDLVRLRIAIKSIFRRLLPEIFRTRIPSSTDSFLVLSPTVARNTGAMIVLPHRQESGIAPPFAPAGGPSRHFRGTTIVFGGHENAAIGTALDFTRPIFRGVNIPGCPSHVASIWKVKLTKSQGCWYPLEGLRRARYNSITCREIPTRYL
ncbi:hypothetical protein B0H17DRAFT_1141003 [Mycena rosella]|uniref:Uncharacterized protein n=1 Tax=Mycena rosella TaxID=1033263 RepID=A0AAD7G6R1_MYCRO|nr:hypothetical protein B0H17DRAFT_1141003 [Mycena rosella]